MALSDPQPNQYPESDFSPMNINGPYATYTVAPIEDTDCFEHKCLSWGFCSAVEAWAEVAAVARRAGVPEDECVVLRWVDKEDAVQLDGIEAELQRRQRDEN